ncbi:hypothetical protein WR25_26849 [Diploscapter pachys]|uniref:Aromatic-L-amino-acid decarboxylase n=1 Tax=Diploscapter pachys TaxID=2018661 RepID=A0A2A2KNB9_9BILA|nr:hypothetical protein WR25_26849 [Diploscapter pachys]
MDSQDFRQAGKRMVDYVADYWDELRTGQRRPLPPVKPGYLDELMPEAPTKPDGWDRIFQDLEPMIMNGNTNWHHPHFFAYFPTACSYPAIAADILSGGISAVGFTWKSCPSMTELEMSTLDWLVDLLNLPQHFKNAAEGPGCGIIQSTASDATLIAIFAARATAVEKIKVFPSFFERVASSKVGETIKTLLSKVRQNTVEEETNECAALPYYHDPTVFEKFVAYCSDQAHSSVEKGAMLSGIRLRKLTSSLDEQLGNYALTKETLEKAIKEDRAKGLIPFMLIATVGTTSTCGVDHLEEIGPVCNKEGIWLHVDAAYAGSFLICPEFHYLAKGMEFVDSYNFNAHKCLMMNFDCSPMWFKNGAHIVKYFNVDPLYLKHEHQATASDYRHLQVALGRRFRSLKIWFVLRSLGVARLQEYLRGLDKLAGVFAELIQKDEDFELFVPKHLGLKNNEENEKLCNALNDDGRIHLVPSKVHGSYFLRLAICSQFTKEEDIHFAYKVIKEIKEKEIDSL